MDSSAGDLESRLYTQGQESRQTETAEMLVGLMRQWETGREGEGLQKPLSASADRTWKWTRLEWEGKKLALRNKFF